MSQKRTVIVGLGLTGMSCLRHLVSGNLAKNIGEEITVVDTRRHPPLLEEALGSFPDVEFVCDKTAPRRLASADRVIVSPGVPLDACLLAGAHEANTPLISDITLFCEAVDVPVIAISGTNGKSTVTTLTGALLRAANLTVGVGGNLGDAALDIIHPDNQAYVLELSSFQLERLNDEKFFTAGLLNVYSDHMDRYSSFEDYLAAKQRIFKGCQTAVFNRGEETTRPKVAVAHCVSVGLDQPATGEWGIVGRGDQRYLCYGQSRLAGVDEIPLPGRHNELNMLMALALAQSLPDSIKNMSSSFTMAMKDFHGLPHRCELVTTLDGIRYIDDSKATNVAATVAALDGLTLGNEPKIVLIAGGDSKQADLEPLRDHLVRCVHDLVVLGRDASRIAGLASDRVPVHRVENIERAVQLASALADRGDVVLLSPACSSLDMFTNFEARGNAFSAAVAGLVEHG